jgi:hypothetical protein
MSSTINHGQNENKERRGEVAVGVEESICKWKYHTSAFFKDFSDAKIRVHSRSSVVKIIS